jgi:hypothetical protein
MALDSEAAPALLTKMADSFKVVAQAPSTTVTGLDHLEGKSVVVWSDGAPVPGEYVVTGGQITGVAVAVTNAVVGLPYTGRYKSGRLAYGAQGGTPLLQPSKVDHVGIVMTDFHRDGVRYGPEFDNPLKPLYELPAIERGTTAVDSVSGSVIDNVTIPFGGGWSPDSRVCLELSAPYPATLVALVVTMTKNDRL